MMAENDFIGAGGDHSSGLDLAIERILLRRLSPFGRIDSEESGKVGDGRNGESIILDPLDGSSNALSRFPYYGISIARLDSGGEAKEALICNLANGDLFRIGESGTFLEGSLYTGKWNEFRAAPFPQTGIFEKAYEHPGIVAGIKQLGIKFRSPGAVALSLAYAHSARFFLFVGSPRIYDFAAGLAFCRGMETILGEEYVIVSRERTLAEKLRKIVTGNLKKNSRGRLSYD